MPDTMRGSASWPGVEGQEIDCTYTCSHGISAGRAVLTIPPTSLAQIAETGDLVLSDGQQTITLKDCHVSEPQFQGGGGQVPTARLVIEDRRWRLRFGTISGRYNILEEKYFPLTSQGDWYDPSSNPSATPPEEPAGEEPVRKETKKDSQELARMCFDALGERNYDVSALDAQKYPAVNWDAIRPADALQQLVEDQGCRVVYQPVQDRYLIAKLGEGADLPDAPDRLTTDAPGVDVKARPATLGLYGARRKWEVLMKLRAVAKDFDGKFVPLDEVSYKPKSETWDHCAPPYFVNLPTTGLPGKYTQRDALKLAQQSVYRMYQVVLENPFDPEQPLKIPFDAPDDAPPDQVPGEITDRRQLKLLPTRLIVANDDTSQPVLFPAQCFGRHSPPTPMKDGTDVLSLYKDTTAGTQVMVPFDIDPAHQLVIFHEYVYVWTTEADDAGNVRAVNRPAELTLLTAVEVYDPDNFQYLRYYRELPVQDGLDAKPAVIVREDVRYEEVGLYDLDDGKFLKSMTNEPHIRDRADFYLRGESLRYMAAEVGQRSYGGLLPIDPDGKIQQVTWSVGGGRDTNPSTTASSNSEHQTYLPNYRERRESEETDIDAFRRNRANIEEDYGVNSVQG